MNFFPDYLNCLDKLENEILKKLKRASVDKKSSFRYLVFSTCSNNIVNSRIVVLRDFCSRNWEMIFHSDKRSEKLKEISNNKNVSLNFWDPRFNFQIRIKGEAKEFNKNNSEIWEKLNIWSKKIYFSRKEPGSKSSEATSGLDEKKIDYNLYSSKSLKNFCQIKVSIKSLDCLILNRAGHRRAFFKITRKKLQKKWLIP